MGHYRKGIHYRKGMSLVSQVIPSFTVACGLADGSIGAVRGGDGIGGYGCAKVLPLAVVLGPGLGKPRSGERH